MAPSLMPPTARRAGGRKAEPKPPSKARPTGPAMRHANGSWGIQTSVAAQRAKSARPGVLEQQFERWFAEAKPGDKLAYFRGELAYTKQHDLHLARLCDRLLQLAVGRWDVLSACGHLRGEVVGAGELMLTSTRVRGEVVHLAIKL